MAAILAPQWVEVHLRIARSRGTLRQMSRSRQSVKPLTLTLFRSQPGEYLRAVAREGKRFVLTKSGKPVALLVPVDTPNGVD
jgi:prevent-host-death family protein